MDKKQDKRAKSRYKGGRMKVLSVSKMSDYSLKEIKAAGFTIRSYNSIFKEIEKACDANMKRYHRSIIPGVIFQWIEERCLIMKDKEKCIYYVRKKDYSKILKKYRENKLDWPGDCGVKPMSFLGKLFLEGGISEC